MHSLTLNETGKNAIREHSFGLASLPSDNINSLMHNDFQRKFLNGKMARDEALIDSKHAMSNRFKTRYDTIANRLRREVGQSLAETYRSSNRDSEVKDSRRHSSVAPNNCFRRLAGTNINAEP